VAVADREGESSSTNNANAPQPKSKELLVCYFTSTEADLDRPERIRAFYLERLLALFEDT
jgi:hypothetical protein